MKDAFSDLTCEEAWRTVVLGLVLVLGPGVTFVGLVEPVPCCHSSQWDTPRKSIDRVTGPAIFFFLYSADRQEGHGLGIRRSGMGVVCSVRCKKKGRKTVKAFLVLGDRLLCHQQVEIAVMSLSSLNLCLLPKTQGPSAQEKPLAGMILFQS